MHCSEFEAGYNAWLTSREGGEPCAELRDHIVECRRCAELALALLRVDRMLQRRLSTPAGRDTEEDSRLALLLAGAALAEIRESREQTRWTGFYLRAGLGLLIVLVALVPGPWNFPGREVVLGAALAVLGLSALHTTSWHRRRFPHAGHNV